jgi:hypothetical protein
MSLWNPRPRNGSDKENPLWYLVAALLIPIVQPARWLTKRVYSGDFDGAFRAVLGVLFGLGAGIAAGHYLGWAHHWAWYGWLSGGIAATLLTYFYAWPALYLFPVHPIWRLCDAIYDGVRTLTSRYFGKLTNGLLSLLTRLPGSRHLWTSALKDDGDSNSWFVGLLRILWHGLALAAAGYLGWHTYLWVLPTLSLLTVVVAFVIAIAAGLFVALLVGGLSWQLLRYGKVPFVGLLTGAAVVAATGSIGSLGLAAPWSWLAYLLAYVLSTAYVVPFVNLALTSGFWRWVWKQVEPLCDAAYDERDKDYALFFHHLANLVATAAVAWATVTICGALSLLATVLITALVAACAYIVLFKLIDHDGGNFIAGAAASIGAGVWLGKWWAAHDLALGGWGGVAAGICTTLVCGFLLFPLLYIGLRKLSMALSISRLGKPLQALYTWFKDGFARLLKQLRNAYRESYEDTSRYHSLVLHLANIAVAVAAVWALHAFVLAGTAVWVLVLLALAAYLSYTLIGKLLFATGFGLEFVGFVFALGAAVYGGTQVFGGFAGHWLLSICAALACGAAMFFIVFPVVYVIARAISSWAAVVVPALDALHKFCWARFLTVWNGVTAAYNALLRLLAPVWSRFVRAWASVKRVYDRLLKIISRSK